MTKRWSVFFSNRPCDARWLLAVWAYSFPFYGFHKRFIHPSCTEQTMCLCVNNTLAKTELKSKCCHILFSRWEMIEVRFVPYDHIACFYTSTVFPGMVCTKKQIWDAGVCVVCCAALLNISVYNNLLRYFMDRWPQMWWCLGFRFFTKCGEETEKCRTRCT